MSLFETPLSAARKLQVSEFKGKLLINLREFYVDKNDGVEKPGRKGISLTVEQYEKLALSMPEVDEIIAKHSSNPVSCACGCLEPRTEGDMQFFSDAEVHRMNVRKTAYLEANPPESDSKPDAATSCSPKLSDLPQVPRKRSLSASSASSASSAKSSQDEEQPAKRRDKSPKNVNSEIN